MHAPTIKENSSVSGKSGSIERIAAGEIGVSPYRSSDGKRSGCDFCPYHGVCSFDQTLEGFSYRKLEDLTKEEVLERIREELE